LEGAVRNLTDCAQPSAMLSKRTSPEDSTTLALAMVRLGVTQTLTMATSPGVKRRTTRNDTGSSSNGLIAGGAETGLPVETGLTYARHPLRALTATAMRTAVRIDLSRPVSIRLGARGLI